MKNDQARCWFTAASSTDGHDLIDTGYFGLGKNVTLVEKVGRTIQKIPRLYGSLMVQCSIDHYS